MGICWISAIIQGDSPTSKNIIAQAIIVKLQFYSYIYEEFYLKIQSSLKILMNSDYF